MSGESEPTGGVVTPNPSQCWSCGQVNKANAAFCRKCGASLAGPPVQSRPEPRGITTSTEVGQSDALNTGRPRNEPQTADPPGAKARPARDLLLDAKSIGAIALLIIIIAATVYFVRSRRYKPSEGELNWIADATFGPNETIAVRTAARGIHVFEISSGRHLRQVPLYLYANFQRPWSRDLRKFVLGYTGTIPVYDCSGNGTPPVRKIPTKANNVWDARFDPTGRSLATADDQSAVEIHDVESGDVIRTFRGHTAPVWSLEFSSNGRLLASGGQDNTVRVWDVESGRAIHTFTGHVAKITALRFSGDARWLLSIADDKTARVWSLENPAADAQEFFRSGKVSDQLTSGAFSPDGRTIALSASPEPSTEEKKGGTIWFLDRHTRRIAWEQWTAEGVKSIEFNPRGNWLLVVSGGTADIWDVPSRRVVVHYPPATWPPGQIQ